MNFSTFINFDGNCKEAVTFYAKILNQDIPKMMTFGDAPKSEGYEPNKKDENRVIYTELKIGSATVMFSDCAANMEYISGNNICLVIGSNQEDEIKELYSKLASEGKVFMELQETFWSKLYGMVQDKFGIIWQLSLNGEISETSKEKNNNGKARHRWSKEIGKIEFKAKYRDGEGCAVWKSSKELVLLAGAKLSPNPQLNKDGSLNFSAQFSEKLRLDHKDKIHNNVTTEDIVFASPNQLGIFLFYGGQNTWEELKDSNGKSLEEWSNY